MEVRFLPPELHRLEDDRETAGQRRTTVPTPSDRPGVGHKLGTSAGQLELVD
jgi:hypothetical protein